VIQRLVDGTWSAVSTATPGPDGGWKVMLKAESTGDYRALSGNDVSETRRLRVSIWKVTVKPTKSGVDVTVTPGAPYAPFLVEERLRERFGWWPVTSGKLDYVSSAAVRVRGPVRLRVVLVDKDGWTPLATSRAVTLPRR
jgi:hypothetical protein